MSSIEKALDKHEVKEKPASIDASEQAELNRQYLAQKSIPEPHSSREDDTDLQNDVIMNAVRASDNDDKPAQSKNKSKQITIKLEHLANQGVIVPSEERNVLNEEYRRIKQPLISNVKGKSAHEINKANLIQVTSSLPGEGKSFTAVNLAIAISQEFDYTVLLVDADLLRPSINEMFDIEEERGLSEYLSGDVDSLSDVLLTTNIPKLSLLPAGKKHHLSSELFSSTLMDNLFEELSERYSDRIVIIDSPPVISTNEANILSRKVGQVVFVIEQNRTTQAEVKEALSKFDDNSVIGIVMNKSRTNNSSGYYYGYY